MRTTWVAAVLLALAGLFAQPAIRTACGAAETAAMLMYEVQVWKYGRWYPVYRTGYRWKAKQKKQECESQGYRARVVMKSA
jgi:hypothetical protein